MFEIVYCRGRMEHFLRGTVEHVVRQCSGITGAQYVKLRLQCYYWLPMHAQLEALSNCATAQVEVRHNARRRISIFNACQSSCKNGLEIEHCSHFAV
jgi:hypothetical protein